MEVGEFGEEEREGAHERDGGGEVGVRDGLPGSAGPASPGTSTLGNTSVTSAPSWVSAESTSAFSSWAILRTIALVSVSTPMARRMISVCSMP